jgi:hypothetical protein
MRYDLWVSSERLAGTRRPGEPSLAEQERVDEPPTALSCQVAAGLWCIPQQQEERGDPQALDGLRWQRFWSQKRGEGE